MSDSFIIPEGITLSMTDQGLVIENEGDIVLNGDIAGGVHALTSRSGNVVLGNDFALHRIDAPNGAVEIRGRLEADRIEAANVDIESEAVTVRVVQASESISIGATTTHAEVLIAPVVNLSPNAVGRITVVECHNELAASKLKGCLSLADLEELFDGSEGFIRGWEISPLHKSGRKTTKKASPKRKATGAAAKEPEPEPEPAPEPEPEPAAIEAVAEEVVAEEVVAEEVVAEEAVAEEVVTDEPTTEPEPAVIETAPEPEPAAEPETVVAAEVEEANEAEEDGAEAPSEVPPVISMPTPNNGERAEQVEQLFDLFDESEDEGGTDPAVDARISEAVTELVSYYEDVDLPPVVQRLAQLVAERDYKTVRDEVDDIWNQLLRYHKQKKLRPKPSLTTTFNTIHAIVREL